ncbi:hypothetical protein SH661x_003312 [Planctomicrobium sp. SH661]|uniref:hypothetical protein n=1 Tax=Planctomicrobium sp. SH661 TaxID=3448124 RepID=UPI003F5C62E4
MSGKVTLDGKPLSGAQVALQPVLTDPKEKFQRPSSAFTDEAGEFSPETYSNGDGLRVGKYRVAVIKKEMVGTPPAGANADQIQQMPLRYKWITPRKFSKPESSGLEVEVTSQGLEPAVIDLTSVQPAEIE